MAAAKAAENHGDEWGLTWFLRQGINISIPTWIRQQNSLVAEEPLSLKIFSLGNLSYDHKGWPNQLKNTHKLCNKTGHPFEFDEKSVETEITTWSEFTNEWKVIVEQILASEEINQSERARLWESQPRIWVETF